MFNQYFCDVCSDLSSFRGTIFEVENILSYLNRRISSFKYNDYSIDKIKIKDRVNSNDDYGILSEINYDHKNTHFMCGHCYKADTHNINRLEDEIKHNFIVICRILNLVKEDIKDDMYLKSFVVDIARSMQGHYNFMHRYLCNNFLN